MALGLWRLTSKQRPSTYKLGDLTVQRQLVRDKAPTTHSVFSGNHYVSKMEHIKRVK